MASCVGASAIWLARWRRRRLGSVPVAAHPSGRGRLSAAVVVELLVPVRPAPCWHQVEQFPRRLDGPQVARILVRIGRRGRRSWAVWQKPTAVWSRGSDADQPRWGRRGSRRPSRPVRTVEGSRPTGWCGAAIATAVSRSVWSAAQRNPARRFASSTPPSPATRRPGPSQIAKWAMAWAANEGALETTPRVPSGPCRPTFVATASLT